MSLPLGGLVFGLLTACVLAGCATREKLPDLESLRREVMDAERAFAATMARRDHEAFARFIADDAVFFTGPAPLRGRAAVVAGWKRFYEGPDAPFSWQPRDVEVLDSGTLAISTGPVHDPAGRNIATFTSIWRREASGPWRVVFDKGNEVCNCAK